MAEKINIDVLLNLDPSDIKSVSELKQNLKDLKSAALEAGEGSEAFDKITKKAGELNDTISRVNESISRNTGNAVENAAKGLANFASVGAGAFGAIQGAATLFGNESKDLQKTLVQLNAAVALSSGLKSLSEAPDIIKDAAASFRSLFAAIKSSETVAQFSDLATSIKNTGVVTKVTEGAVKGLALANKALEAATGGAAASMNGLKSAIIGTGIGLFVAGLGLAIQALVNYTSKTKDATKATDALGGSLETVNNQLDDRTAKEKAALDNAKLALQIAEAQDKSAKDLAALKVNVLNAENNLNAATLKGLDDALEAFQKLRRDYEIGTKEYEFYDNIIGGINAKRVQVNNDISQQANKRLLLDLQNAKDIKEEELKNFQKLNGELRKLGEDDTKRKEDKALNDLKITQDLLNAEKKAYEDYYNKLKTLQETGSADAEKTGVDLVRTIREETITATEGAEVLTTQRLDKIAEVARIAGEFSQGFSDFANTLIDNDVNKLNEKYSAQLQNVRQGSEEEKKILAAKFAEEEKLRKKAFLINKGFQLATAVASTAQSVATALAAPPGIPFTIPNGILAGALGAVQIAKIAATSYQNPTLSSGGLPSAGGSGVGGAAATTPAESPTPNSFSLFGTASNGNIAGGGNNGQGGAVQVYVLESDISSAQFNIFSYKAQIDG
jgi:hypothetical protein